MKKLIKKPPKVLKSGVSKDVNKNSSKYSISTKSPKLSKEKKMNKRKASETSPTYSIDTSPNQTKTPEPKAITKKLKQTVLNFKISKKSDLSTNITNSSPSHIGEGGLH